MTAYHQVGDLVTSGLTACTPGSAPGSKLGNEYGKPLPLPNGLELYVCFRSQRSNMTISSPNAPDLLLIFHMNVEKTKVEVIRCDG